jgi:high-affinity K+ transport system ATPase subunit B
MNISKSKSNNNKNGNNKNSIVSAISTKVILDSLTKLDPRYLAKNNPVMFTVELGFLVVFLWQCSQISLKYLFPKAKYFM